MNPLTQQHITHITLSGRGQNNVEGLMGNIYGKDAERQHCKSGKLCGEGERGS